MEVRSEPQGFDMDENSTAPIYNPEIKGRYDDDEEQDGDDIQEQPIYYQIPESGNYYNEKPSERDREKESLMNGINPMIWMVIVFVAFILGFFMGMGSGGKGGQAPIILAPRGNM